MAAPSIRPLAEEDRRWARAFLAKRWGSEVVAAHGEVFRPAEHDGFVAEVERQAVGLVTYRFEDDGACEVLTIDSTAERQGIGTALLDAVVQRARDRGSERVWLITTNDNLEALRFYQRRGFQLVALRPEAVERARDMKPEIPPLGRHGIPIRDELELELELDRG
jgi:ribosomal protein S18 acetylase RimI-like enzyme